MHSLRLALVLALTSSFACAPAGEADDEASGSASSESVGDSESAGGSETASESESETGAATLLVSGDAFAFTLPGEDYGRIAGATIGVLEQPELSTTSDAMGHFEFPALPAGATATFTIAAEGFPPARTKTFTLPEQGPLERVTFQVPNDELFGLLAQVVGITPDPGACQMVTTVTRVGKSIYDAGAHGEAGATVTISPAIPAEHGPVYFNSAVIPDMTLTETSDDGGVVFVNVPPGEYVLTAHEDGVTFEDVTMQCEAGVLVNASPPYGLQAL